MKKIFTFLVCLLFTQASVFAAPPTVTGSNLKFSDLDGSRFSAKAFARWVYYISVQYADKKYQHTLIKH